MQRTTPSCRLRRTLYEPCRRRQPDGADSAELLSTDLAKISVPVLISQSEHDELSSGNTRNISLESIPNEEFVLLNGVSHFAPLQRPRQFTLQYLSLSPRFYQGKVAMAQAQLKVLLFGCRASSVESLLGYRFQIRKTIFEVLPHGAIHVHKDTHDPHDVKIRTLHGPSDFG
jgi:hypothetical protein